MKQLAGRVRGVESAFSLRWVLFLFCLLAMPSVAHADAGVPMVFVTYPAMLVALFPVILLEAAIFQRRLLLGYRQVAWRVGVANAVSTVIGFPLTWFLMAALQLLTRGAYAYGISTWWSKALAVTWQSPWLIPYEKELYWMVPTAALVGLIPAFLASVFIEGHILKRLFKVTDAATTWKLTWKANGVSYLMLASVAGIWLVHSVMSK